MMSDILTSIVETLDVLEVFDRSTGKTPFMFLDGHGSRLGHSFLNYINNPLHPWSACIGVPYGTSLWQVGDSKQQNGSYKMALARIKKEIIDKKTERLMPRLTIKTQ